MKPVKSKDVLIMKYQEMNKKLSKYIAPFDSFDKALLVLSATNGGIITYKCYWSFCRNSKSNF